MRAADWEQHGKHSFGSIKPVRVLDSVGGTRGGTVDQKRLRIVTSPEKCNKLFQLVNSPEAPHPFPFGRESVHLRPGPLISKSDENGERDKRSARVWQFFAHIQYPPSNSGLPARWHSSTMRKHSTPAEIFFTSDGIAEHVAFYPSFSRSFPIS